MDRRSFIKALALFLTSTAAAPKTASATEANNLVCFSPEIAREYGSAFAEAMTPDLSLSTGDPIPLFSVDNTMIGYEVDYYAAGAPHGYVLFDVTCPSLVSRFTFEKGSTGLYSLTIASSSSRPINTFSTRPRLFKFNSLEFGSVPDDNSELSLNSGKSVTLPKSLSRSKPVTDWSNLMVPFFDAGYAKRDICYGPRVGGLTEETITSKRGKYACAVSALYNIAAALPCPSWSSFSNYLIDGSDYSQYEEIWSYTSTTIDHSSNGIDYGSTRYSNIGSGFSRYCASKGRSISSSENYSPSYDQFKDQASKGRFSVFTATIRTASSNSGEQTSGHSMAAWGAASLAPVGSSSYENYVLVYDGWKEDVFIRMNDSGYINQFGTFFSD